MFISAKDAIFIVIVACLYLLLCSFQLIIFPTNYFSVRDILYSRNLKQAFLALVSRTFIIWMLVIVLEKLFLFSSIHLLIGVSIGSFLCVWPSIYQYQLFSFLRNIYKAVYLIGCIASIAFSFLTTYFADSVLLPILFAGKEFFLLENAGVSIVLSLLPYLIPFGARWLSMKLKANPYIDADTFQFDLFITYRKIDFERKEIDLYHNEIKKYAEDNGIDYLLLETVLQLEYINRGSVLLRCLEKVCCYLLPGLAIKLDLSVGIAQIKISTAARVMKCHPKKVARKLLDDDYCIEVCAKYLYELIQQYQRSYRYSGRVTSFAEDEQEMKLYSFIASQYLCGANESNKKFVYVYSTILYNCVGEHTFGANG